MPSASELTASCEPGDRIQIYGEVWCCVHVRVGAPMTRSERAAARLAHIREGITAGRTQKEIAIELGCSRGAVAMICKSNGIRRKRPLTYNSLRCKVGRAVAREMMA